MPEPVGGGASSEPRTWDLTSIEGAIWRGSTDGEPIPDHWPEWLMGAALEVVRVVEQQSGTEGEPSLLATVKGWQELWDEGQWTDDDLVTAVMHLDVDTEGEPGELLRLRDELARLKALELLPPESPEHQPDGDRCECCGMAYDDDSVGAECSRLESDVLEMHDALVDAGYDGAINSESIVERVKALTAERSRTHQPDATLCATCGKEVTTGQEVGAGWGLIWHAECGEPPFDARTVAAVVEVLHSSDAVWVIEEGRRDGVSEYAADRIADFIESHPRFKGNGQ